MTHRSSDVAIQHHRYCASAMLLLLRETTEEDNEVLTRRCVDSCVSPSVRQRSRIRLDRASEAQPRPEPVVGQARINSYGLLKISLPTAPHAMGFGTAKPANDDGSGRHCNEPVPTVLCWEAQTAVFAVFERVHPSHPGGAAPLWRQLGGARLNGSGLPRGCSVVQEPRAARFVASRCAWARRNQCTAVAGVVCWADWADRLFEHQQPRSS